MAVRRKSPAPAQSSENLTTVAQTLAGRWPIMDVWPVVESGRRPAKAVVGEVIPVSATCFREGHSHLGVSVILRRPDDSEHSRVAMRSDGGGLDRWTAQVSPDAEGP